MSDDETTRKVKSVRRKTQTPVTDQPTRKVKAVQRRPAPRSLGLLPPEALKEKCFRFLETNLGWGLQTSHTPNRYEVQLTDRTPLLYTPRQFSMLPGWHFEVRDMSDVLRFTLTLGLQKLVMRKLTVFTPGGEELGRLEQRFSLMEVKFDVLNPDGSLRFTLYQPGERFTEYEIRDGDFCVARISKDRPAPVEGLRDLMKFEDAFRVDLESSTLDERDRVLIIAAAIFMDRLFQSDDDG